MQVRRKLETLEKGFWSKALGANGFTARAKQEEDKLLAVQQSELASLRKSLQRFVTLDFYIGCDRASTFFEVTSSYQVDVARWGSSRFPNSFNPYSALSLSFSMPYLSLTQGD